MKLYGTWALPFYPIGVALSLYATWIAGRYHLGYWPRPMLDDPKYIEGFWMWLYDFTALLFVVGFPLAIICASVSIFRSRKDPKELKKKLLVSLIGVLSFFGVIALLNWDPNDVGGWYMD